MADHESLALEQASQKRAFGPGIWGWGLLIGVLVWVAGFSLFPWWLALLVWWWPSTITGAAISLASVALVQISDQRKGRARGP